MPVLRRRRDHLQASFDEPVVVVVLEQLGLARGDLGVECPLEDVPVIQAKVVELARILSDAEGVHAIELNISCPNVTGGIDFGTQPETCRRLIAAVRGACELPLLAKLTPNVTDVASFAKAAEEAGADAIGLKRALVRVRLAPASTLDAGAFCMTTTTESE